MVVTAGSGIYEMAVTEFDQASTAVTLTALSQWLSLCGRHGKKMLHRGNDELLR